MKKNLNLSAVFIALLLTEKVIASDKFITDDASAFKSVGVTRSDGVAVGKSETVPGDLSQTFIQDVYKQASYMEDTTEEAVNNTRTPLKRGMGVRRNKNGEFVTRMKREREGIWEGLRPTHLAIPSEKWILKSGIPPKMGRRTIESPSSATDRRALSPFSSLFSKPTSPNTTTTINLPDLHNKLVHKGDEDYDQWFAGILYDGGNLPFEHVDESEYTVLGRFMPAGISNVNRFLYDERILVDSETPEFVAFLDELRGYAEYPDDYDFWLEQKSEACRVTVVKSLGKASTIDNKSSWEFDSISVEPQRVLMGPKYLFYYPGMLKLSALFDHLFDKSRSTDFFNQFVTTVYSGVYGPRRRDLYDIVRIQSIPASVIDDQLIRISVGLVESEEMTAEAAFAEIERRRQEFASTDRDVLVREYGRDLLHYKELTPVPKTLEDVLDLTAIILQSRGVSSEELRAKVKDQENIETMQSFYLNRFDPFEVKKLMEVFMGKLSERVESESCGCLRQTMKESGAAVLYAAYILTPDTEGVAGVIEKFEELMREVKVDRKTVEMIHESSIKVSEMRRE